MTVKPRVWYKLMIVRVSMSSVLLLLFGMAATVRNLIHSGMVWKYGFPFTQKMFMNNPTLGYCAMMGIAKVSDGAYFCRQLSSTVGEDTERAWAVSDIGKEIAVFEY